jgi:hypothetical protein
MKRCPNFHCQEKSFSAIKLALMSKNHRVKAQIRMKKKILMMRGKQLGFLNNTELHWKLSARIRTTLFIRQKITTNKLEMIKLNGLFLILEMKN